MGNLYKWSIYYREMLHLRLVMTLSFLSFLSTFSFLYVWCKIKLSADENNERTEMMKRHIRKKFMLEDGSYCYFDNLRFHNVIKELSQKSVNEGKRKTQSELIMEVSMAINVSESSIYHWIKGDNSPSDISRVEELARFLRISLFDIVEKEELSVGGNNKNMSFSNEVNDLNEKSVIRDIGTAFFSEYVGRMIPVVLDMEEQMKQSEDNLEYFPDILSESSKVIMQIVSENFNVDEYPYIRELHYEDCFGSIAVGRNAMDKILLAWKNEPKQFRVDRKQNKLVYEYPQNSNMFELQYILNELPSMLNAKKTSTSLIMELDKAEELFEMKFKKRIWER